MQVTVHLQGYKGARWTESVISEFRNCGKGEVAVVGSRSLIACTVSVDVKQQ